MRLFLRARMCFFIRFEGFYIDRHVTFADLFATMDEFWSKLLGEKVETRFRPSYFPFVEPGLEVDVRCTACHGKGCRLCKHYGLAGGLRGGDGSSECIEEGQYRSRRITVGLPGGWASSGRRFCSMIFPIFGCFGKTIFGFFHNFHRMLIRRSSISLRKSGRVAECACLENRKPREGFVGSNPTSSEFFFEKYGRSKPIVWLAW